MGRFQGNIKRALKKKKFRWRFKNNFSIQCKKMSSLIETYLKKCIDLIEDENN